MPILPSDLANTLRNTLDLGFPTPYAYWILARWDAQQDKPDAGRGIARMLDNDYAYTISQIAQLSEYDRRTLAAAYVRFHQSNGAAHLTTEEVVKRWMTAIEQAAQR